MVDARQLHRVVVGGAEQRVVVAGTEQLVDEADLAGRRRVGAGRAVLPLAAMVRLLALGPGLLPVPPAFLGVLGAQQGVLLAGPLGIGIDVDDRDAAPGSKGVWAVGPLSKARRWEIIAVPDIRGQAETVAAAIAEGRA